MNGRKIEKSRLCETLFILQTWKISKTRNAATNWILKQMRNQKNLIKVLWSYFFVIAGKQVMLNTEHYLCRHEWLEFWCFLMTIVLKLGHNSPCRSTRQISIPISCSLHMCRTGDRSLYAGKE